MNDIVAEFASSYYKSGETRPNGFSLYDLKQYHVVAGSVFSDEYNETLDSATLVLDHVKKEDRLVDIEPYEYVHVFDKNHPEDFDRIYLVDNFSEQEKNINQHLFSYTISLMSETKLLEKIQCPNVAITHRVQQGATEYLSIYEHMKRYMELYVPYAKMRKSDGTGWEYRQIITIPDTNSSFYTKFNIDCADMAFNMPTLRQLLTTLMQQVGCIPVVRRGVLSYLNLRAEPVSFGRETDDDFTVSRIQRSLSSDSYANTLVNISDNVLDSGNKVISETLGFRDKDNSLLKQQENLYLETKFPIYKITKGIINIPMTVKGVTGSTVNSYNTIELVDSYRGFRSLLTLTDAVGSPNAQGKLHIQLDFSHNQTSGDVSVNYYMYDVEVWAYSSTGSLIGSLATGPSNYLYIDSVSPRATLDLNISYVTGMFFVMTLNVKTVIYNGDEGSYTFYTDDYNPPTGQYQQIQWISDTTQIGTQKFNIMRSFDITPIFQENSVRQNLKTNFKDMPLYINTALNLHPDHVIEALATFYYGTVGYTIGSNRISGFSNSYSETFSKIFGPLTVAKTFIEVIIYYTALTSPEISPTEFCDEIYAKYGIKLFPSFFTGTTQSYMEFDKRTYFTFAALTFDIEYQPLNSFNLSFSKQNRDIPYAIQQLDTNASGLTDFDRLVLREQETVDRIGNVILSVSQRTKDLSQIRGNPTGDFSLTYFLDDLNRDGDYDDPNETRKYILFKRQIAVNDYYYDVSYTGMENAILKDYFTSIRTKYRAYELVDYNQSVLRKERDTIYVGLMSEGYIKGGGSDNLHFEWDSNYSAFVDGFTYYVHNINEFGSGQKIYSKKIKYVCEFGIGSNLVDTGTNDMFTIVKNDISTITSKNILAFIYENSDNAGSGTFIPNVDYSTYYTITALHFDSDLEEAQVCGIPQRWQIWWDKYADKHPVLFTGSLNISQSVINSQMTLSVGAWLPIINYQYEGSSPWSGTSDHSKKFSIGTATIDNDFPSSGGNYARVFYKDYSERINHTVQFVYYTDDPEHIAWTEEFIANCSLAQKANDINVASTGLSLICKEATDAPLDTDTNWYEGVPSGASWWPTYQQLIDNNASYTDYINIVNEGSSYCIEVTWHTYNVITVASYNYINGKNMYKNLISFKKPEGAGAATRFYITFNDTKSNFVLDREQSGLLRKVAKVEYNGITNRGIIDL